MQLARETIRALCGPMQAANTCVPPQIRPLLPIPQIPALQVGQDTTSGHVVVRVQFQIARPQAKDGVAQVEHRRRHAPVAVALCRGRRNRSRKNARVAGAKA